MKDGNTKKNQMVHAPTSLLESSEQIEGTLNKLQPKLRFSPFVYDGEEFLKSQYSKLPKKIQTSLSKLCKTSSRCQLCNGKLSDDRRVILTQTPDWNECSIEAKQFSVCCEKCYKISNLREFLDIYLEESFIKSSSSAQLSGLIEHYLLTNGYKLSDLDVFNAAVALVVSLRTCVAKLNLSQKLVEPRPNLESFISSLTSSSQ